MAQRRDVPLNAPIVSRPGAPAISAVGTSLVVHEWTGSGPSYMHIHRSDDEAWHVLEGSLRFRLADGEVDAPAGQLHSEQFRSAPRTSWPCCGRLSAW